MASPGRPPATRPGVPTIAGGRTSPRLTRPTRPATPGTASIIGRALGGRGPSREGGGRPCPPPRVVTSRVAGGRLTSRPAVPAARRVTGPATTTPRRGGRATATTGGRTRTGPGLPVSRPTLGTRAARRTAEGLSKSPRRTGTGQATSGGLRRPLPTKGATGGGNSARRSKNAVSRAKAGRT